MRIQIQRCIFIIRHTGYATVSLLYEYSKYPQVTEQRPHQSSPKPKGLEATGGVVDQDDRPRGRGIEHFLV